MFYCCPYSIIEGIKGEKFEEKKSNFSPNKNTLLLRFSPWSGQWMGYQKKDISKRPTPKKWVFKEPRDESLSNSFERFEVFAADGDFEIWCEDAKRYLSLKEIEERGYINAWNNDIIQIEVYPFTSFEGWREIKGNFYYILDTHTIKIRTK